MLEIHQLRSVDELRRSAPLWDDLWRRSDVTMPSVRAELMALWVEQFAAGAPCVILVVEDRGRWVAGLPLVEGRVRGAIRAGRAPANAWSPHGELLLDPRADVPRVLDSLVAGMRQLPWQLLWLDEMAINRARWNALQQALERARMSWLVREQYDVGFLAIDHDWPAYRARWSRNHRRFVARSARRLREQGPVRLEWLQPEKDADVAYWTRRALDIEHRSWKGESGTSARANPGMVEFYIRQAQLLARHREFVLAFLYLEDRPIAFEYAWAAKGVYHALKVGYDPQYAACSPGHLLMHDVLQRLYAQPEWRGYDFLGPLIEAHAKWVPAAYRVGRIAIAIRGPVGRLALRTYQVAWPLVRRLTSCLPIGTPQPAGA